MGIGKRFVVKLVFLAGCWHVATGSEKPNIVVFLVDDMGWMDSSVPFCDAEMPRNQWFHTPNMERLAKQGMLFTNAYATSVCTPTRVSLMTGMNAAHHRVTNWTSRPRDIPSDFDSETNPLKTPVWNYNGFSPVADIEHTVYGTPLPALLADAGYFTIHVGKAHFAAAGTPGASPYNMGFVVNKSGNMAGMPQSYYGEQNYGNIEGKTTDIAIHDLTEYYGTSTYLTEAITREALKALDYPVKTKTPFFLYMAHYAVHLPLHEDPRFVQRFYDAGLDSGAAKFSSMVASMDHSLGELMDYLEEKGIADETLILFFSDNGGHSINTRKGGKAHTQNLPLKEGKGSLHEGGIRVPMIAKWPGHVKAGSREHRSVIVEDFFPTLLEVAGNKGAKTIQRVDGRSFMPLLKGTHAVDTSRALIWHYPNKWKKEDFATIDYLSAIRKGEWKLIYHMAEGKLSLYHLATDMGEVNDIAGKHPDKVRELTRLLTDKLKGWNSPMPSFKEGGQQVPWPDEVVINNE